MTLQLPAIEQRSEISWRSPTAGLWVATRRGEHAGMVERLDGRYHATSARDRALGSFEDLDAAFATVDIEAGQPRPSHRGLRVALWAIIGSAAATAVGLTLALIR
jgi:hypothetical protein